MIQVFGSVFSLLHQSVTYRFLLISVTYSFLPFPESDISTSPSGNGSKKLCFMR